MTPSISHYLPLYTAAQMRKTDHNAIKKTGIPGAVLMERAGMAVAEYLLEHYCEHHRFVILAGKGNNGGDGFVIARYLLEAGAEVKVLAAGGARDYRGDALTNLKIIGKLGLKVAHSPSAATVRRALSADCVAVDAIFGTGFSGEPRGKAAQLISLARSASERHGIPVIAVDIASGVNASTGEVAEKALPADTTVTFHVPKIGHFVAPGSYYSGDVILSHIGIPQDSSVAADHFLSDPELIGALIPRKMDYDNKFSTGSVLVVGGSTGLTGAACMASESALRSGAGVVTAAVPESLNDVFEQKLLEVMTLPLQDTGSGHIAGLALDVLLEAASAADCVAFGPGLGREPETIKLVLDFLARAEVPVVLDADGLFAISGKLGSLRKRKYPTILTPHAGELGRLLGVSSREVAGKGLASAKSAAKKAGAIVTLKGSSTIITDGSVTLINPTGNAGLATAGAGDVLTGVIAALVSKGLDPLNAAGAGVFIHGTAADLAAEEMGIDNLISSDLIDYMPMAFLSLEDTETCD